MKTTEEMFWEIYPIIQQMAEQFKLLAHTKSLPAPAYVIQYVADHCGVSYEAITTKTRKREIAEARQLLSTLLKFGLKLSASQVGIMVGNFDHATVLHSIQEVSVRYHTYKNYRIAVQQLIESLFSDPKTQEYIIERIIDPHLDRKHSYAKLVTA